MVWTKTLGLILIRSNGGAGNEGSEWPSLSVSLPLEPWVKSAAPEAHQLKTEEVVISSSQIEQWTRNGCFWCTSSIRNNFLIYRINI